jgi:hypothetical protein
MAFTYPPHPHTRRHGPRGYRDYRAYKPWLRDECDFRCVYCLWCADGDHMFSVDHLWPQMRHPARRCDYDNLVYACCQCNAVKQGATMALDPCAEAFGRHLALQSDGSIHALTARGAEQIALCRLNRPRLLEARRMMLALFRMLEACESGEARKLLRVLHSVPDNLPRLSALHPPDGNTRPASMVDSYYAKRRRGELSTTY